MHFVHFQLPRETSEKVRSIMKGFRAKLPRTPGEIKGRPKVIFSGIRGRAARSWPPKYQMRSYGKQSNKRKPVTEQRKLDLQKAIESRLVPTTNSQKNGVSLLACSSARNDADPDAVCLVKFPHWHRSNWHRSTFNQRGCRCLTGGG
ncbi:hypothetical protein I7I51_05630 [Histoplasma capsulatum]|uniref:Uncharacterized protein n=1 Tax=Ajellomyces capsulatus TaxID=5037 RepID=A0A8A1M2V8_AJECA|nr:hypothetical protein I7I51_05630 [Histoplasma capsulatum]